MKKLASLLMLVMMLFTSCGGNVDNKKEVSHYYLEIVNESEYGNINAVSLLGYYFSPLAIERNGDAQTFTLSNGMIAGNENVFVSLQFYMTV